MFRGRLLLLVFTLFRAGFLHAEPAQEGMTLEAATRQFLSEAPRARAARARVQRAEAEVIGAGVLANPALELQHSQLLGHSEQIAGIGITLPISGRRGARVEAARAGVQSAQADAHLELARLVGSLHRTFLEVVYLQQQRAQLSALLDEVSRLERIARRRAELGQISGFDSLRLLSEGDLLRSQAAALEVDEARARAELMALLGRPSLAALSGRIQDPQTLPDPDQLLEQALRHGAVAATRARIEQSQLLLKAARREALPEPGLQGGLWRVQEGAAEELGFVAGISVPLPLLNHGQGGRAAARADLQVLEAEAQALEAESRARITGGLEAAQKARARAETFEKEGLARAEQAQRQAGVAYEAGQVGLPTLMETLRATRTAREHALEAHFEARMAEIAVGEAAGLIPGKDNTSGGRP